MTPSFLVLDGGLQTTVQDLGRRGAMALGIPLSGALDPVAMRLANRLVGNQEDTAVLEFRSQGPAMQLVAPFARVALAGTDSLLIVEREGRSAEWPSWRSVDLLQGDIIRLEPFADSGVAYLAVFGGIDVPELFGSRSTFLRGGFGGLDGKALKSGDLVPLSAARPPDTPCLTLLRPPSYLPISSLRAIPGPQAEHFAEEALNLLFSQDFTVTRDIDRMGLRLEGPRLRHLAPSEIVTDGTAPGTIQVPASGQPILLLADCQTTGGYPKIATVISADLSRAGRLAARSMVRFACTGTEDADQARIQAEHDLNAARNMIVPVRPST